jgi:hypothetical protein
VSREERLKLWDKLYDEPGFGIWLANFREIFMDEAANAELSEYIAGRIRRRVRDQKVAEKLIPRDHGFGVQRLPLETNYFEAYNRDNVHLVDISETPLVRVTEKGLRTTARDYEFDCHRLRHRLRCHHRRLRSDRHPRHRRRAAGRQVEARAVDLPRHARARLPEHADARPDRRAHPPRPISRAASRTASTGAWACCSTSGTAATPAPTPPLERSSVWTAHVIKMYEIMLMRKAKSWFTGYNSNVPGHEEGTIRYFVYNGGTPKFVGIINDVAAKGYQEIEFSSGARSTPSAHPSRISA